MKAVIKPSATGGMVKIPPSKSMAHRAIICACLARGESVISNIDYSVDITTTIDCMRKLGAVIDCYDNCVVINGIEDFSHTSDSYIQCNESGSTLRFLIPLFSLTGKKVTFTGKNRLLKRPLKIYEDMFTSQGLYFSQTDEAVTVEGALSAGEYTLAGNISSQFISGLLFTLPLLENDSTIKILPPCESRSYINLTIQMLSRFGIDIQWKDDLTLFVKGGQKYVARNETVEGDFSRFAFFAVLSAINSTVLITGMNPDSIQGDRQILDVLSAAGCDIKYENNGYLISASDLSAVDTDLKNCPDLGPILCTLAMFSRGESHISNTSRLKLKESDRAFAMKTECGKMGCSITVTENDMYITGGCKSPVQTISGWNDHRIVMATAIALTVLGGEIEGCEAITKSYPSFFDDLKKAGADVTIYE
ncbi:MAG: 3-phosphoshikimate 1-carboxyvinyltransferase [Oscillospiraceae bacterium]|nr:3-phosphoshikimate 1-carboxyvinyltransferase [Oscillospiraceae bacterium]